jgi:hypothetical protein
MAGFVEAAHWFYIGELSCVQLHSLACTTVLRLELCQALLFFRVVLLHGVLQVAAAAAATRFVLSVRHEHHENGVLSLWCTIRCYSWLLLVVGSWVNAVQRSTMYMRHVSGVVLSLALVLWIAFVCCKSIHAAFLGWLLYIDTLAYGNLR